MGESHCHYVEESTVKMCQVKAQDEVTKYKDFTSPITSPELAPEMWDHILRYISSNDFLGVINTCPEWNQLLSSRKTTELFALVFPHLLPYFKANELLGWLPLFDLLKKNPFLSRHLHIDIKGSRSSREALDMDTEFERLKDLLSRFGGHIWTLQITFYQTERTGIAQLVQYLSQTPNLNVLELAGEVGVAGREGARHRALRELPTLKKLRQLQVTNLKSHSITSNFITRYGRQLTTLMIDGRCFELGNIRSWRLRNLRKLCVVKVSSEALLKLSVIDLPLQVLQLELSSELSTTDPTAGGNLLLLTIFNFEKSLVQLELSYQPVLVLERLDNEGVLTTIKLDANHTGFDEEGKIDLGKYVFQWLPKLEGVVFRCKRGDDDDNGRQVKYVIERSVVMNKS